MYFFFGDKKTLIFIGLLHVKPINQKDEIKLLFKAFIRPRAVVAELILFIYFFVVHQCIDIFGASQKTKGKKMRLFGDGGTVIEPGGAHVCVLYVGPNARSTVGVIALLCFGAKRRQRCRFSLV